MPLTEKGEKVLSELEKEYPGRGKQVLYAGKNSGRFTGIDDDPIIVPPADSTIVRAAGILIVDKDGKALFLKRGNGSDYPGLWAFPGGRIEEGEDALTAAIRETKEEAGFDAPVAKLESWTRQITDSRVDFSAFLLTGVDPFVPVLGPEGAPEHVAYAWAPIDQAPEPLHPGARISLDRFAMDELGIARAIAAGQLTSPQHYKNIDLFALRISGTGVSFRSEKKDDKGKVFQKAEYVYRRPENYLSDEFLARCNGLPVVMMHPEDKPFLDTEEFANRVVGTIMLPYIVGDEVWGIAKIYDGVAASMMRERQLSTSPGILLGGADQKMTLENGDDLLIEGKAALLDHLAVCEHGVWDKGGEPAGVATTGDMVMAEENRQDAAGGQTLDKVLSGLDDIGKRMDAMATRMDTMGKRLDDDDAKKRADGDAKARKDASERCDAFKFSHRKDDDDDDSYKKRHDAEEEGLTKNLKEAGEPEEAAADKAKKRRHDAEEGEDKERADKAKKDDDDKARKDAAAAASAGGGKLAELEKTIKDLASKVVAHPSDADFALIGTAHARYDSVYSMFGKTAPRYQPGETLVAYRRRMASELKSHSPAWKQVDLGVIAIDEAAFGIAEKQILEAAALAARSPASVAFGMLREVKHRNDAGHTITEFVGSPLSWMDQFAQQRRAVTKINMQKAS